MEATTNVQVTVFSTVGTYLELMKLRIVLLLCFTTVTTMIVAADGFPKASVLIPTWIGGILAAGGASAVNQYLDRDMDARMARTAKRPIPSGRVAPNRVLVFGALLIALSVIVLVLWVNPLAAMLALGGAFYYLAIYTMLLKRNTVVNILIGGGAGAFPVLVGWTAVTDSLSYEAFILFAIIFYWTPPHSWALALLVNKDYAKANVPMMPAARGKKAAQIQIVLYATQLFLVTMIPVLFGVLDVVYFIAAIGLGLGFVWKSFKLLRIGTLLAARSTYKYSTAYLAFLFLAMIVDRLVV